MDNILPTLTENISEFLKVSGSQELSGGLRCTTKEHSVSGKFIAKQGDYEEFARQSEYVESLPPELKSLFPKIFSIEKHHAYGLMMMEQIDGYSLHDFLFLPQLDNSTKRSAFKKVLDSLEKMNTWIGDYGSTTRDVGAFVETFCTRLEKISTSAQNRLRPLINELLKKTDFATPTRINASILHGDAQSGNFMIQLDGNHRFIDPLGGSGRSPGDWVYDWSRLHHWTDSAGIVYEYEGKSALLFKIRYNTFNSVKGALLSDLMDRFHWIGKTKNDQNSQLWFSLYSAFHLSGKMTNFKSDFAQNILLGKMEENLQAALAALG